MTKKEFLVSSEAILLGLLALNLIFGKFFEVNDASILQNAIAKKDYLIIDL